MENLYAVVLHYAEHSILQLNGVQTFLPLGHRGVDIHTRTRHCYISHTTLFKTCPKPNSPSVLGPQPHSRQNTGHFLGFFSHQIRILCTEI